VGKKPIFGFYYDERGRVSKMVTERKVLVKTDDQTLQ